MRRVGRKLNDFKNKIEMERFLVTSKGFISHTVYINLSRSMIDILRRISLNKLNSHSGTGSGAALFAKQDENLGYI